MRQRSFSNMAPCPLKYLAKRGIVCAIAFAVPFFTFGCSTEGEDNLPDCAETEAMDVNDTPFREKEGLYDGGVSTVMLHETGVLISSDSENKIATVAMDEPSGLLSGQEVTFDFTKHTETLPVKLVEVEPGDRVEVTYFYETNSKGFMTGESLVPSLD